MGIAAGILLVFLIFSTSISKFIGDENVTNLSHELKETATINRDLNKQIKASQKQFDATTKKLDKIKVQLKTVTIKKDESLQALSRLREEVKESLIVSIDEETDQFTTKEQRKINALEERLEAVMADRKVAERDFEDKKEEARRRLEELAVENEEIRARMEDIEISSLDAESSDLGILVEELAAENEELQAKVTEAESVISMVEEANKRIEELTSKNAELEKNINKLRETSEQE